MNRYRLIYRSNRGGMFYAVDKTTGKRTSLQTADRDTAEQLIEAKNNSHRQPSLNFQIARAYLSATDPAFDAIRRKKLLETSAEDFLTILKIPQVSVGHNLRRLHNLALMLGWLPVPVLAPKLWPKPQGYSSQTVSQWLG